MLPAFDRAGAAVMLGRMPGARYRSRARLPWAGHDDVGAALAPPDGGGRKNDRALGRGLDGLLSDLADRLIARATGSRGAGSRQQRFRAYMRSRPFGGRPSMRRP